MNTTKTTASEYVFYMFSALMIRYWQKVNFILSRISHMLIALPSVQHDSFPVVGVSV